VETASLPAPLLARPGRLDHAPGEHDLLVISNRLPPAEASDAERGGRKRNVGGLVAALEPALQTRRGLWLGWSGQTTDGDEVGAIELDESATPARAQIDFPEEWYQRYYNGFSNRILWPLFHSFPRYVSFDDDDWVCYLHVNRTFAEAAAELVSPQTPVWIHDYHLLLVGHYLRQLGHSGPLGLFLHIPFPGPDLLGLVPWAEQLLDAMLDLDLIGFHTQRDVANFRYTVSALSPARLADDAIEHRGRRIRVGAFPIGTTPEAFQEPAEPEAAEEVAALLRAIAPSRLILGVDRLDYTKGIPERLEAFEYLLAHYPQWRRRVALVQISVPSREDVPEYRQQRQRIENIVGRVNGEYGEATWVPIRYLYRSYSPGHLAALYRAAAVGYVTPLRDGMNLVAKEYVAAQNPDDPGVLLLSRFAGAAAELTNAVLTNPWHPAGVARDLDRALSMPLAERQERHRRLLAVVSRQTAATWAESCLGALFA
jgi:trehalose 6-phosphate synthase